ncbi:unnamed protein product, partial [Linum tenue]
KQQDAATLAQRIQSWTRTIVEAQDNNARTQVGQKSKEAKELSWHPPPPGWIAINTDGSVKQPDSRATAGGLLRDLLRRCIGAFASNLGSCTITRAELKGTMQGLQLAWSQGHRRIQLRTDSTTVLNILSSLEPYNGRYQGLMRQVQRLLQQNWEVTISHTFREGNKSADYLANKGHSLDIGVHVIDKQDSGLKFWLLYDTMGIAQTRLI